MVSAFQLVWVHWEQTQFLQQPSWDSVRTLYSWGYRVGWLPEERMDCFKWFPNHKEHTVLGAGSGRPPFPSMEQWKWNLLILRKENREDWGKQKAGEKCLYLKTVPQQPGKALCCCWYSWREFRVCIYLSVTVEIFSWAMHKILYQIAPPCKMIFQLV